MTDKWAIYGRVSTDREEQRTSIPNQIGYCTEWIIRNGGVVYDTYIDDGISGKSLLIRPDVQRLLADAEARNFIGVVFNNISRFGRDNLDLLWMKRKLVDEWGLKIVALEEGYDSDRDEDEMLFIIHSGMSQSMRKKLSRQIKHSCKTKAERGEYALPVPPLGYVRPRKVVREDGTTIRPENYKLQVDLNTAPIVKSIFELARNGYGAHKIVEALSKGEHPFHAPVKPTGAKQWYKTTIMHMLRNPVYVGTIVFNKGTGSGGRKLNDEDKWIIRENAHEPIIDRETFDQVQDLLRLRKKNKGVSTAYSPLVGIARCGICGYAMRYEKKTAELSRKTHTFKTYEYYSCKHEYLGPSPRPKSVSIRVEILNQLVLDRVKHAYMNPETIDNEVALHKEKLRVKADQGQADLKVIAKELTKIERSFRKDLELFRAEAISIETFKELQAENELARENLQRRKAALEQSSTLQESLDNRVKRAKAILAKFADVDTSDHVQLKTFLVQVLEKVVVNSANNVEIKYRWLNQELPEVPLFLTR